MTKTLTDQILNLIIYGDIYEVPLTTINDLVNTNNLDQEQEIRLSIAASVRKLINDHHLGSGPIKHP